jgi:hypothetical protein
MQPEAALTTADYALFISGVSALISIMALLWNVWQKYLFVKPSLQVAFGIFSVLERQPGAEVATRSDRELLSLMVTNLGPGPVILYACVVKLKADLWKRGRYLILNPIHGDPTSSSLKSLGPFSGGLPGKIDAGEMKSFYFPYDKDCCLRRGVYRVAITDTYGRYNWCRRRDVKKADASYRKDFGNVAGK